VLQPIRRKLQFITRLPGLRKALYEKTPDRVEFIEHNELVRKTTLVGVLKQHERLTARCLTSAIFNRFMTFSQILVVEIQHLLSLTLGDGHDATVPVAAQERAFVGLGRSVIDRLTVDGRYQSLASIEGETFAIDRSTV